MELVVLGTGAAYPGPQQASSGYLLRQGGAGVLIDCGNGIVPRLQEAGEFDDLTALVFSHLHADHLLDIFPLYYARLYSKGKDYPILPVYVPAGEAKRLRAIAEALRVDPGEMFSSVFELLEYDPGAGLRLGDLRFSFSRNEHPVPTYAIRVEGDGGSFVYSADTGPSSPLPEFAAGCDLLLVEASLGEADFNPAKPIHLTPRIAAEIAVKARAGRMLLTHLWPFYDRQEMLAEARQVLPDAELAEELARYPIPGRAGQSG